MMGERTTEQTALFYEFSLERHVPADHLLRSIDRFVDLSGIREHLRPYYSEMGRPSVERTARPPVHRSLGRDLNRRAGSRVAADAKPAQLDAPAISERLDQLVKRASHGGIDHAWR